jgi:hypothetical protein
VKLYFYPSAFGVESKHRDQKCNEVLNPPLSLTGAFSLVFEIGFDTESASDKQPGIGCSNCRQKTTVGGSSPPGEAKVLIGCELRVVAAQLHHQVRKRTPILTDKSDGNSAADLRGRWCQ